MFNFEKVLNKYRDQAGIYLDNQPKTDGLLNQALIKGNSKKGILGDTWSKFQLLVELVRSYSKGEYKNISQSTILTLIGAVIYFISPIDLIPDFIISIGLLDDTAVIGFTLKKVAKELDKYNEWKNSLSV